MKNSNSHLETAEPSPRKASPKAKREGGIALMVSILLLIAVSGLALSTMQTAASDGTVAGFQNQEQIAFYAAEAGIAQARRVVRNMGSREEVPEYPGDFPDATAPVEIASSGDFYGGNQPEFYADPAIAEPISYIGEGTQCTEGCNMTIGGLKYNHTKWQVTVVGESPSGDQKRLEMVATRLLAVGY
ncbi:MAG: PilX N-terminal domain-containing pilus assembly protein [Myxococcota bacterium]